MAIRILTRAEQIGTNPASVGDYILYNQSPDGDVALPWVASRVETPLTNERTLLGCFSSKTNALTFVLAHEASGWEDGGVLRTAAIAALQHEPSPRHECALQRLGLAIAATDSQRPRALVVVENGLASVYATPAVDTVVVNLDLRREFALHELLPIHSGFTELLERAGVRWPTSRNGRRVEAIVHQRKAARCADFRLVK
ncbi:MAG: hypothetical protein ACR2RB_18335 [Gammaproteobacteria bacterium]